MNDNYNLNIVFNLKNDKKLNVMNDIFSVFMLQNTFLEI